VLHNCLFQADLKTPFISHLTFEFDHVFDEHADNAEVYRTCASDMVRTSRDGGVGTMFMFGQTGSGKTHTLSSIQQQAAADMFAGSDGEEPWITCQFIELRGNRCFDLLAPGIRDGARTLRPEVKLREQRDGSYSAEGAVDLTASSPEELCSMFDLAASRRATCATDANSVSSRSHAVCTLRLLQSVGQLMLVDCAGTERRKDSMYHSKERQQEGAEINASLHALKECIRHLAAQAHVPSHAYRASSLTKILADAFIRGAEAKLAVVCTASPCATDSEHTIGTMRMGMALSGQGNEKEEKKFVLDLLPKKKRLDPVKNWKPDQVFEWLERLADGKFHEVAESIPSNFTGQMLVRLSENRCVQLCGGSERRGRQLFDLLHQEMQRVEAERKQH
jgi:kinesin family protein 2/24